LKQVRMDEQELMARVQAGDEEAFSGLVGLYKDRIVNYLYHFTGDYQKAVDLSQETFIRVYFKADKYRPIAPLSSWIYSIAGNLARSELKRSKRRAAVSLDDIPNEWQAGTYSEDPDDTGLVRNIREALNSLHPRYRIPIILKDIEGFSQEEIAEIIHRPVGTVKARISRARSALKRKLQKAVSGESILKDHEVQNGSS